MSSILIRHQQEAELLSHYDEHVEYYSSAKGDEIGAILEKMSIRLGPTNRVLDIGCGDGRISHAIARKFGCKVFGVDYSQKRLEVARRNDTTGLCAFAHADVNVFLEEDSQLFDVIIMFEILEHLTTPETVLEKARLRLAQGGIVAGSVPIDRPYKAHLQVFKTPEEVCSKLGVQAKFLHNQHLFFVTSAKVQERRLDDNGTTNPPLALNGVTSIREPARRTPSPPRESVSQADAKAAWEFKREFFWNAFKALEFNGISGDYAEFGSHGARTFRLAWDQIQQRQPKRHLWAFDSFCGLPTGTTSGDPHPKWTPGAMATDLSVFKEICISHGIGASDYTVVQGFYEESLGNLSNDSSPTDIALAYVDCDLHSSTRAVLNFLKPRLKPGMIIGFDDYFCWSKDQISGERRALLEFISNNPTWHFERYRDFGWTGVSFVVECLEQELAPAQRANR